jgi:hypothetical protein
MSVAPGRTEAADRPLGGQRTQWAWGLFHSADYLHPETVTFERSVSPAASHLRATSRLSLARCMHAQYVI